MIRAIIEMWKKTGAKKRPRGVRSVFWAIGRVLLFSYLGFCAILWGCQSRFVYFPQKQLDGSPEELGLSHEEVFFSAADGVELHGWFVPAKSPRGAVLFCHGNAGNISHRLESLYMFNRLGLSTFIFDYRGYGKSQGKPSEKGTYLDAAAAWKYLTEKQQIPPGKIIVFGRSLGGSIAAHLCRTHTPGALIMESTFTSAADMAAEIYPFLPARLLCRFDYSSLDYAQQVKCPLLIVHSRNDEIIPFSHGRKIFEAAGEPKEFLEIAGSHNDGFLVSTGVYEQGLDKFISEHLGEESCEEPRAADERP